MPKKRRADEYENEEGSPAARNKKVKKDPSATKKAKNLVAEGSEGKGKINNKKKSSSEGGGKKKVPGDGERDSKGEEFWEVCFFFPFFSFSFSLAFVCVLCIVYPVREGGGGEMCLSSSAGARAGERGKK